MTPGRIYLVGREARRNQPKKVDYLLRYKGLPIAVVEAKEEVKPPDAGLGQAYGTLQRGFITDRFQKLRKWNRSLFVTVGEYEPEVCIASMG